jgi:hypothetical protein
VGLPDLQVQAHHTPNPIRTHTPLYADHQNSDNPESSSMKINTETTRMHEIILNDKERWDLQHVIDFYLEEVDGSPEDVPVIEFARDLNDALDEAGRK